MAIKRHIPNIITCCNLFSGCIACVMALEGNFLMALLFIVLGATFDFFDGMVARLLKVASPLGVQMDSLADDVTFGLAPAAIVFSFMRTLPLPAFLMPVGDYLPYYAFVIAVFSALRLAKFNIDDTQTTEFCGLPTPANGLFCLSLAMLMAAGDISLGRWAIVAISVGMAYMLISPVRMFALKFKGFGWKGNEIRYSFIAVCILLIALFTRYAVPAIILLYMVVSAVRWAINVNKK